MLETLQAQTSGKWAEGPNGIICNPHALDGGIIDCVIGSTEWFVIFNRDKIPSQDGFPSRDTAIRAFLRTLSNEMS